MSQVVVVQDPFLQSMHCFVKNNDYNDLYTMLEMIEIMYCI